MITVQTPAKLNLTLEVLGKRDDGYHEIRSVIQAISLYDSISFDPGPRLEFNCDMPDWMEEKSLVSIAANLLQEVTGCTRGARISINKRIPLVSGLGGDSSGAAATLRGLNEFWGLGLSRDKLVELAMLVSSDVAFFLYGGTALAAGRGEIITVLPSVPRMWAVLVVPNIPRLSDKTAMLYSSLKKNHFTDGGISDKFVNELKKGAQLTSSCLFNTFENVAYDKYPREMATYREHFWKLGASTVHVAGTGPTQYTMLHDKVLAEELYIRCRDQKLQSYLVETVGSLGPSN